jgi:ureidoacrylate peracid hydrolase
MGAAMSTIWGKAVLDTLEERVAPSHTAIIAVDLQNDFAHPDGHGRHYGDVSRGIGVLAPNRGLLEAARRADVFISYTQQVRRSDGSMDTAAFLAKSVESMGIEPGFCFEGTWGAEICDEVAPVGGDVVVRKNRRSGFAGTNLDVMLRDRGIKTTVITGLAMSGCVEATVRDAIELGYYVVVPRDCVDNYTLEQYEDSLKTYARILMNENLTTSERLLQFWDSGAPSTRAPARAAASAEA